MRDAGMTGRGRALAAGALVLTMTAFWLMRPVLWPEKDPPPLAGVAPASSMPHPPAEPLPGERILRSYASADSRAEDDLAAMAHAVANLALLVKGGEPFRLGANEEIAAALRGENRARIRFLPEGHRAFDAQGRLVDRWGTPLFFHALSHERLDIRSAGPDRRMWTEDDIHRRHDGAYLGAEALNAPSLFEAEGAKPDRR